MESLINRCSQQLHWCCRIPILAVLTSKGWKYSTAETCCYVQHSMKIQYRLENLSIHYLRASTIRLTEYDGIFQIISSVHMMYIYNKSAGNQWKEKRGLTNTPRSFKMKAYCIIIVWRFISIIYCDPILFLCSKCQQWPCMYSLRSNMRESVCM